MFVVAGDMNSGWLEAAADLPALLCSKSRAIGALSDGGVDWGSGCGLKPVAALVSVVLRETHSGESY